MTKPKTLSELTRRMCESETDESFLDEASLIITHHKICLSDMREWSKRFQRKTEEDFKKCLKGVE